MRRLTFLGVTRVTRNETIRAWLLGMNPDLDDEAPIEEIRNDRGSAVAEAARNFRETFG